MTWQQEAEEAVVVLCVTLTVHAAWLAWIGRDER